MCRPASMVVAKGPKAFWSTKTDSHCAIRDEFGLPENGIGRITSVQIEIVPDNNDFALPLEHWDFRVDQSELPDWWDAGAVERECRVELEKWAKARLVRHGESRTVTDCDNIVAVCGGGIVQKVLGDGTVQKVLGGGIVKEVFGGGTVQKVLGGGIVKEVLGGGIVQKVLGGGIVQKVLGGGIVQEVWGGTVQEVCGGTVQEVWGGGTVVFFRTFCVKLCGVMSVVIDRTGSAAVCHIGGEEERTVKSDRLA